MGASVRELRPTRRGYGVAAVALAAFLMGVTAGARSLNAVVAPALVAFVAAGVQLARADAPTIERTPPEAGFPGETRTVTVDVDSAVPCTVSETLGAGVGSTVGGSTTAAVGHGGRFDYDLECRSRGVHTLGPAACRLTDSLGLFARRVETTATATALVYPDVYEVTAPELSGIVEDAVGDDGASFDRLREFGPGDRMSDIHWRASARRTDDEFLVADYRSQRESDDVSVVGEAADDADAMATTVASVALHLVDAGVTVDVTVPGGRRLVTPGDRTGLLRLLARTGGGSVGADAAARADIYVGGEADATSVAVGERRFALRQLTDGTPRGGPA